MSHNIIFYSGQLEIRLSVCINVTINNKYMNI